MRQCYYLNKQARYKGRVAHERSERAFTVCFFITAKGGNATKAQQNRAKTKGKGKGKGKPRKAFNIQQEKITNGSAD
jgi:hypothetical protein